MSRITRVLSFRLLLYLTIFAWLAFFLSSLYHAQTQTVAPHWDFARHQLDSLQHLYFLQRGDLKNWFLTYNYYPPLVYWLTSLSYFFFGYQTNNLVVLNFFFMAGAAGLIFSLIIREHRTINAVSALALLLLLFVSSYRVQLVPWELMLDLPLVSLCLVAFFFYRKFLERPVLPSAALFLGIITGLAILTKRTGLIFLLVPGLVYSYRRLRRGELSTWLIWSFPVALAISWYIVNAHPLARASLFNIYYVKGALAGNGSGPINLLAYIQYFVQDFYEIIILILVGLLLAIFQKKSLPRLLNLYELASLVFPMGIIISITSNTDRYLLSTYYYFLLLIFLHVERELRPLQQKIIALAIILTAALRILLLPNPDTRPSLPRYLLATAQEIHQQRVYVFFEDDSKYLNFINADLSNWENYLIYNSPYFLQPLNLIYPGSGHKNSCPLGPGTSLVAVYSNDDTQRQTKSHQNFRSACRVISSQFIEGLSFDTTYGRLAFYNVTR